MAEHGGYRAPSNPAPVSGPGAHSARTDGGPGHPKAMALPDAKYGEAQAFAQIQSGAPLSQPAMGGGGGQPAPQMPPGFGEPTAYPDQPVTSGADAGDGPSMKDIGIAPASSEKEDLIRRYGHLLPYLIRKADDPSSSDAFKAQVRYLVSVIG